MSTLIQYVKPTRGSATFKAILDGTTYDFVVRYNLYGRRPYVECYDLGGTLQFSLPLVESPTRIPIETLTYDELRFQAVGTTVYPHGLKIGATAELTVVGTTPPAYLGTFLVLATGPTSFSYPLPAASAPAPASAPGAMGKDISLSGGYFANTLTYRAGYFEIGP